VLLQELVERPQLWACAPVIISLLRTHSLYKRTIVFRVFSCVNLSVCLMAYSHLTATLDGDSR
jgi:hypothetical protein